MTRDKNMPSNHTQSDIQRLHEFDFLCATEIAALNCMQWVGKGDKEAADAAACDAIRDMFDLMDICGEVVIGEGIKDQVPGLFKGERVGKWRAGALRFDIALDPVDGTTNVARIAERHQLHCRSDSRKRRRAGFARDSSLLHAKTDLSVGGS